jgi:hypothetical protein
MPPVVVGERNGGLAHRARPNHPSRQLGHVLAHLGYRPDQIGGVLLGQASLAIDQMPHELGAIRRRRLRVDAEKYTLGTFKLASFSHGSLQPSAS